MKRTGDELTEALKIIDETKEQLETHNSRLETKKKLVEELKDTLKRLMALDSMDRDILVCRAKAYFYDHLIAQGVVENVQQKVAYKEAEAAQARAEHDKAAGRTSENDDEINGYMDQIKRVDEEIGTIKETQAEVVKRHHHALRVKVDLDGAMSNVKKAKQTYLNQQRDATREVQNTSLLYLF